MQSSQAVENTALCGKALIDSRNFEDGRKTSIRHLPHGRGGSGSALRGQKWPGRSRDKTEY